ncbi:hypothetical protein CFOL_v3_19223, partial [Cephalotus follicularis]
NSTHLINVMQGKDESLRDYLTRFNKESLKVKDLESTFTLAALNSGLKDNSPFTFSLMKKLVVDMADLLRRAKKYVNAEEAMAARKKNFLVRPSDGPSSGSINLLVVAGTAPRQTQVHMTFLVVDTLSPYNILVWQPRLNFIEAIVSTRHLVMKFPTRFGVREIRGDQQVAR